MSRPRARGLVAVVVLGVFVAGVALRPTGESIPTASAGAPPSASSRPVEPAAMKLPVPAGDGSTRAVLTPSGVVAAVISGPPAGPWTIRTPCGNQMVLTRATPISGATIVLDPGHGGEETGAVGVHGIVEKDVNLAVAQAAKRALEARGATVVLTRTEDYRMTVASRAEIAARLRPLALVSIHHNGAPYGRSHQPGTEAFYQRASGSSRRLAGLLYEEILETFAGYAGVTWHGNPDAGAKYRTNSKGQDFYGILRRTPVPTVLSEGLFLSSSASEAQLLARPPVQEAEGQAVARAVARFLLSDDPGSGFVEPIPLADDGANSGGGAGCVDPPMT